MLVSISVGVLLDVFAHSHDAHGGLQYRMDHIVKHGQRAALGSMDSGLDAARRPADIDRFHDIFAEFLQTLVFVRFALQRTIEPRILDGDRYVVRQGHEQFNIVAR